MANNYDRIELLIQTLQLRHKTATELSEQLDMSIVDLYENLEQGNADQIRQIAEALEVPEAFFWGGLRLENGQFIPDNIG